MNILDPDYPVIARVARITATRALCMLNPKYLEIVQYVQHMLPEIHRQRTHLDAEQKLSSYLSEVGVVFNILDTDGVPSTFDDEHFVCLLLDSAEKVVIQ